jgi:general nucleoside transport system ATP-binding protein
MKHREYREGLKDDGLVLEATGIAKSFAGIVANRDVHFQLGHGEIHALVGQNGAGKSTLASILTGLYHPDSGEIRVRGKTVRLRNPRDALTYGIGIVHQHFHLVENFTVAENVMLGDPRAGVFVSRQQTDIVASVGDQFDLRIDAKARIADLSVGERQRVEIVKMLYRDVDILLLDEPTAVLTPQESEALFKTLRSMAAGGKSIVFITHKLDEVMAVADNVTVMRDARVVGSFRTAETTVDQLARLMVGDTFLPTVLHGTRAIGEPILLAENVTLEDYGHGAGDSIRIAVHAGEIVGVAGVAGNGQLQLAESLAGLRHPSSGTVRVNGIDITGKGPRAARGAGLAYVPQDRLGTGLARGLSIAENMILTQRLPLVFGRGNSEAAALAAIADYDVKAPGPREVIGRLSGGNVQKILLAREIGAGAKALIAASPTQGLDISAVEFVHGVLDRQRAAGVAILLISEDLDEIRTLADRIIVMYAGRIVLERRATDCELAELGLAMAGATAGQ